MFRHLVNSFNLTLGYRQNLKLIQLFQKSIFKRSNKACQNELQLQLYSTQRLSLKNKTLLAFGIGSIFSFFQKEPELTPKDEIVLNMKKSILSQQRGELLKAQKFLTTAWEMSTAEGLEDAKTQILGMMANLAVDMFEFSKAEHLYKSTVYRLLEAKRATERDNSIIEISLKLAAIYARRGKHPEAISGYEYCIKIQREKIEDGETDSDTYALAAWALHSLAQFYVLNDKDNKETLEKSKILMEEGIKYAVTAGGSSSEIAMTIISDYASILAFLGDYDKALSTVLELEPIAKQSESEVLHASIQINIGNIYLQKENFQEAKKICEDARIIATKLNDSETLKRAEECLSKSKQLMEKK